MADLQDETEHQHPTTEAPAAQQSSPTTAISAVDGASASPPNNESKRHSQGSPKEEKPTFQALGITPQPQPRGRKRQPERLQKKRKRGKTPPAVYSRRDRTPEGLHQSASARSPSPRRSPSPEQPRQRKRPGGGARIGQANLEALRRRQEERDRQRELESRESAHLRGVQDVVRQHYNSVPERGREWRKTDSKIKGLRAFNNWIKSCMLQKFSPDEEFLSKQEGTGGWADSIPGEEKRLLVADLGCGKGGDLGKWQQAPQPVELYVGLDPAEISIQQAKDRYAQMRARRGRQRRGHLYHAEFFVQDCFGHWLGHIPILQEVGIDPSVGPTGNPMSARWGGGGFDVVASMFAMHYAFESEEKARQMLHNVAGLLKKGGRFIGVLPNSDVLSANVVKFHQRRQEMLEAAEKAPPEEHEEGEVDEIPSVAEWGNSIYHIRFPGDTPKDGVFRPAFGWKYSYFLEEAVEEIPEYVVPWEAFRALTEEYNLELQYRKPFLDIWSEEMNDPVLGPLSERMGVRARGGGPISVSKEELEAAGLYHAFCFYKV